jgi:hypothetical protein
MSQIASLPQSLIRYHATHGATHVLASSRAAGRCIIDATELVDETTVVLGGIEGTEREPSPFAALCAKYGWRR